MKEIGDVLKQNYPDRKLPLSGYIPYTALWLVAPLIGLRRDLIKCAWASPTYRALTPNSNLQLHMRFLCS